MRVLYIIIFSFFGCSGLNAQIHTNALITFDDINPNCQQLVRLSGNEYLLTSINFINDNPGSTFINYNINSKNYTQINLEGYSVTRKSVAFDGLNIYAYGNDDINGPLFTSKISLDFETKFLRIHESMADVTGGAAALFYRGYMYGAAFDEYLDQGHKEVNVRKFDSDGNEVWSRIIGQDARLDFPYEIDSTADNNLLLASGVELYNKFGRYNLLTKVDTSGNIIWQYEGDEAFDNGSVPNYIAQLSNGNIVQTYYIRKTGSFEFNINPRRLKWFSQDGEPLFEKLINFPYFDQLSFNQIEAGKGDYFFAYGYYRDDTLDDRSFGLLIKYDLEGNELWRKRYQHPDFQEYTNSNSIRDIEELENGNLMIYASISLPTDWNKMWLFEVDANGCHDADNCDEINILTTSTHEIDATAPTPTIAYPNPTSGITNIHDEVRSSIKRLELYDIQGALLKSWYSDIPTEINMSLYTVGTYILKAAFESGRIVSENLVLIDN